MLVSFAEMLNQSNREATVFTLFDVAILMSGCPSVCANTPGSTECTDDTVTSRNINHSHDTVSLFVLAVASLLVLL